MLRKFKAEINPTVKHYILSNEENKRCKMLDTKVTVFTMDNDVLGVFNLSDEQLRLLDWLSNSNAFDDYFGYEIVDKVEDM